MAGDWIKMHRDLESHPKVQRIAGALGRSPELVVYDLYRVAGWFSAYGHYGKLACAADLIDARIAVPGFAEALADVCVPCNRRKGKKTPQELAA